ncbi:MAG: BCCT family transporter, partial [Bacteroidota bacterium]
MNKKNEEKEQEGKGIKRYFDIHPPVFWTASILLAVFIAITLIVGEPMKEIFQNLQDWISDHFGWFLILAVNFYLFFALYFAFSKYSKIRLGGRNAVPEFSRGSWFAMLFSAGMGIGILFWSVAEPLFHFTDPPLNDGETVQAAQEAMKTTFLHWGLH